VVHLEATTRARKLRTVPRLVRLARRVDLVHCTDFDATLWGRLAATLARRPATVTHHSLMRGLQVSRGGAPRGRAIALHNRLLDPVTTWTVACARCQLPLLEREGVAAKRLVHIPNGVPVGTLREHARSGVTREQLGIPPAAQVIAHVGRVNPHKGQLLTLETVARIRAELGDVHVVFAGSGPDLPRLEARASELGAGWAHVLGHQPNVAAVFALADLAVLPSDAEAMPMVVLEALAVGVPVVATDVGDLPAMLDGTGAGMTVPIGDADAYRRACSEALASPHVRARLRDGARRLDHEIDADTMVARYAALFERTLSR
jgi:glycosyltransferase involved in cell wall biosynthesis